MVRKIAVAAFSCVVCGSVIAHDYPVLFDVDDQPIGPVLSIVPLSAYDGSEAAQLLSSRGYSALIEYSQHDFGGADDYVGWNSYGFYESADCSGDPIVLPTAVGNSAYPGQPKALISGLLSSLARNKLGILNDYDRGDMLEYQGELFYVPYQAERDYIPFLRSMKRTGGICRLVDRCDDSDVLQYVHLVNYPPTPEEPPPGGWCEGEEGNPAGQIVALSVGGYRLSSLSSNDPEVTGFESKPYHHPMKIRFADISIVGDEFALNPGLTGTWWNTDRAGEGFLVEFGYSPNGLTLFASFYTYDNMGNQAWLVAQPTGGSLPESDTDVPVDLFMVTGPMWGDDFDPDDRNVMVWGTGTMRFPSCTSGSVTLTPSAEAIAMGYTELSYGLTRDLLTPGIACPSAH